VIRNGGRKLQRIPRTKSGLGSRRQMDSRSGGDLSNHPALGASRPQLCAAAVGNKRTLVCTGVGVESLGRGGRTTLRVSNRVVCQISEARRRIPASCPFPESPRRQSRATRSLPGRVGSSFGVSVPTPSSFPRFNLGERTTTLATVPTGLAVSREPTRSPIHPGRVAERAGIARASWRSYNPRSIARSKTFGPGGPHVRRQRQPALTDCR
jgi:hypothetical protein